MPRAAYLAEACAGDAGLRAEAESLLASLDAAGSFIETPAAAAWAAPAADPLVGATLGSWRLLGEIARGGMGVVYRARRDDDSFQKEAAVKVLPAGVWTAHALDRFRAERAILARLDHPGIARLLDGGTAPDGRPYYVMELVDGEPIDVACDRRGLSARERLSLFAAVCDAVHYAHQGLVLHRDLKPGNILVGADGAPRLLDFGVAKLLDPADGGDGTLTELRAFTPRYASPEQVSGAPLTTASDVYSLGVVLYELLAGTPPYEIHTRSPEELVRVVCRQEPERPSAARRRSPVPPNGAGPAQPVLARELEGDLDWIALKALRKEPARRYASARELAEDVRRHLDGRPVLARPDTLAYRTGKFLRRHRLASAVALVALVASAVGLAATVWQWRRAEAAHAEAERRFADVRRLAGSLLFEVHDAIEPLPGSTAARALIVKRGVEYLDGLAAASIDPSLRAELAAGYLRLGDVQGRSGDASLGDATAARDSYRKAVRLAEALVGPEGTTPEQRELLSRACARLAESLREAGERAEADALLGRAVVLLEQALAEKPGDARLRDRLAARRFDQAAAFADAASWSAALEAYRSSAGLYADLAAAEPANPRHRRNLALAHKYLGGVATRLGRPEESRRHYETAVEIDRELLRASPLDPAAHLDLSYDLAAVAKVDENAGRPDSAVALLREALALRQWVLERDPVNVQARAGVARAHADIAWLLGRRGDWAEAEAEMRRSVAERERVAAQAKGAPGPPLELAKALGRLGEIVAAPGRPGAAAREAEACSLYRRSERLFATVRDRLPPQDRDWTSGLAIADRCRAQTGQPRLR